MRRLRRALDQFLHSSFTWRRCWALAKDEPRYQLVPRDGYLYIEPRR